MDFSKIQNPRVRQYLEDKYAKQQEVDTAKSNEGFYGGLADAGASLATAAVNSSPKVQYYNRMQDLGKAPKMGEGYEGNIDATPVKQMLKRRTADAQEGLAKVSQDFEEQNKLDTYSRNEADLAEKSDPTSKTSKTYQELAKRYMPGQDWSNISAAQLEKSLPILGKAYEAEIASKDRAMKNDQWEQEMAIKRQDVNQKGMRAETPKAQPTVPSEVAGNIGKFDSAVQLVDDLDKAWNEKTGTFSGITQWLPNTDSGKYNDQAKVAAQTIGSILEGGKLTDNDYSKYLAMLPAPGDSQDTKNNKIATLKRQIDLKKKGSIAGLEQAGYNTKGFKQAPASDPSDPMGYNQLPGTKKPSWAK
jgi:hypothetical protein